jgi:hypothetical protein
MKVTKEIHDKMLEMRCNGATYKQIQNELGISKITCIKYLREIPIEHCYADEEWKQVEDAAEETLKQKGYKNILSLNEISNSPYWDYYAEKDNERWLIDVTINSHKSISDKIIRMLDGFRCAILYKTNGNWKLFEMKCSELKEDEHKTNIQ